MANHDIAIKGSGIGLPSARRWPGRKAWRLPRLSAGWTLVILAAFVVAVSAFVLSKQSLRLDEAQSLWQSSRSPSGILYVIAQDVHVPLYPLLLHFWQVFFGNGIAQVRILSLLFYLACIPAIYHLGRLAFSRTIGLFAAVLVAASPFLNWYGNEARMYSMLMLVTILNQYAFVSLLKGGKTLDKDQEIKYWLIYGLTALAGIYTHYFFWFLILTQAVFFAFSRSRFPPKALNKLAAIEILLLLAIAPWLYYVRHLNMLSNAEPILTNPTSVNFFNTFSQFVFGFQNDHLNTLIVSLWPLAVLFAFLSLRKHQKIPAETVYFFLSALLPVVLAFIVSALFVPLFVTRYMILTVPSLFLFISWFLATYAKRLSAVFKTALVLVMLATLAIQVRSADSPVKEDYRQASEYLDQHATAQDVVIISSPFTIYPIEYYYKGPASLSTLPIWNRFVTGPIPKFSQDRLPQEVQELKGSHQRAFLILSYNQGYENQIKSYFDNNFQRLDGQRFSQDLDIYVYKLRYDDFNVVRYLNPASPPANSR